MPGTDTCRCPAGALVRGSCRRRRSSPLRRSAYTEMPGISMGAEAARARSMSIPERDVGWGMFLLRHLVAVQRKVGGPWIVVGSAGGPWTATPDRAVVRPLGSVAFTGWSDGAGTSDRSSEVSLNPVHGCPSGPLVRPYPAAGANLCVDTRQFLRYTSRTGRAVDPSKTTNHT